MSYRGWAQRGCVHVRREQAFWEKMGIELGTSRMFTSRSTFQKAWVLVRLQTNSGAGAKQKTKWTEPNEGAEFFLHSRLSRTGFIPAWTRPRVKTAQQHFRSSPTEIWIQSSSSKQAVCTKSWDSHSEIKMAGGRESHRLPSNPVVSCTGYSWQCGKQTKTLRI